MSAILFLLCPTDCLETIINKEYRGKNYFYNSLGNTLTYDSATLASIKCLVIKHNIGKICFVLSEQNKIVKDALGGQIFSKLRGLQNFNEEIKLHKEQSELFWKTTDPIFSTLSYYLNQKIIELKLNFSCELRQSVNIKGKVYLKSKNTLVDIYPDLVCLTENKLN